jgi:hypothetical protein
MLDSAGSSGEYTEQMRLTEPFVKLPIRLDAGALAREVNALPPSSWVPHAAGFPGNEAVRLVTPHGQPSDAFQGPMQPTEDLGRCPHIMQAMAELGGVWGRSRLMGLGVGGAVPRHVDTHYHWRTHLRIHVPIITNPQVEFTCGGETVHMAPGECWVFDSFRWHEVHNRGQERRVHLVLDTVVTERLWDLIDEAHRGPDTPSRLLEPGSRSADELMFEQFNAPKIMSPWEIKGHVAFVAGEAVPHPSFGAVMKRLDKFIDAWASLWARFGPAEEEISRYLELATRSRLELDLLGINDIKLKNELELGLVLDQLVFSVGVAAPVAAPAVSSDGCREKVERPIFIVSTPRSGSTLLFETLAQAPELYTVGGESHALIENIEIFAPYTRGWHSNRLTEEDATPGGVEQLARAFYDNLRDRDGRRPAGDARMLEKTPKNALRVPFFDAAWPEATFIYLYRDVRETLSSMLEAWRCGGFRTYPRLPGWTGQPWSLLLVPGWPQLNGRPLPEVVAKQWATTTETLLDDLEQIPRERLRGLTYHDFTASPQATIEELALSLGLKWDRQLGPELPLSKTTVSRPNADKWRSNAQLIEAMLPIVEKADLRARAFVAQLKAY